MLFRSKIKEFFKNIFNKAKEFINKKVNDFENKRKLLLSKIKNKSKLNESIKEDEDDKNYDFSELDKVENGEIVIMYYHQSAVRVYLNINIKNIKNNFSPFDKLNDLYEKYNNSEKFDSYGIKIKNKIYNEIETNINNIKITNSEYYELHQTQISNLLYDIHDMFGIDDYNKNIKDLTSLENDISKKLDNIRNGIKYNVELISDAILKFDKYYKDGKCTKEQLSEADNMIIDKLKRIGPSFHIVSYATKILTDDILKIVRTMDNCLIINRASIDKLCSLIKII